MFNISIKAKLYGLLVVVVVILTLSSVMTYRSITPVQNQWDHYLNNVAMRQALLMDIKAQFGFGGTIHNFKNYILRANNKYYERLGNNFSKLNQAVASYQALTDITATEKQALSDIKKVVDAYEKQTAIAHKLISEGKKAEQVDVVVKVDDSPAFKAFDVLDKTYQSLTDSASVHLSNNIHSTISSTVWGSLVLIVVIAVSLLLITRVIVRRLNDVQQTLHNIENTNDIGVRLATDQNDEISEVFHSLNKLLDSFSGMIKDIISASVDVGVESSNQASIVEKTVRGVHQQHQQISLVKESMLHMSATVQNVSSNAEQAVGAAQLASAGIATGSEQMSQMINTMDDLNHSIETASQTILELEQESQQISSVLEVIHGISEQTNLLALNAAIEAARAGEQGRGFAVVADEVRALAARTKDSTDEIRQMIERLQSQVQSAVKVMDKSRQNTNTSSEQASETGHTLHKVSDDITEMSNAMSQIATTSGEQFQVSEKMGEYIDTISDVAVDTAKYADDTLIATGHIGEKTERLREAATQFKINDDISQLEQAKSAHLAWRSKLMSYLSGDIEIDQHQLASHRDCVLGKWYYSDGLANFSHIAEMQALELPHEEIHRVIHHVVELKAAGDDKKAMQEFEKITPLSQQIVNTLDKIIEQI